MSDKKEYSKTPFFLFLLFSTINHLYTIWKLTWLSGKSVNNITFGHLQNIMTNMAKCVNTEKQKYHKKKSQNIS